MTRKYYRDGRVSGGSIRSEMIRREERRGPKVAVGGFEYIDILRKREV